MRGRWLKFSTVLVFKLYRWSVISSVVSGVKSVLFLFPIRSLPTFRYLWGVLAGMVFLLVLVWRRLWFGYSFRSLWPLDRSALFSCRLRSLLIAPRWTPACEHLLIGWPDQLAYGDCFSRSSPSSRCSCSRLLWWFRFFPLSGDSLFQ